MDAQIHSRLRVLELHRGGAFIIPAKDLSADSKEITEPLGLTLWASRVDSSQWNGGGVEW